MSNMKARLSAEHLLDRIVTSTVIDALLQTLQIQAPEPPPGQTESGQVVFGVEEHALGVFNLSLIPPPVVNDPRAYFLSFEGAEGARTGFRLAISLEDGPQRPLFNLLRSLPSHGLVAAAIKTSDDGEWLEADPAAGDVQIVGQGLFLVLEGQVRGSATLRLSSNRQAPDDVVVLQVQPPTVLIGSTGFGFEFTHGIVIDLSSDARPADGVVVNGVPLATPADTPPWQGIAINRARFFLPKGVPFLGAHAVEAWLQVGLPPTPGIDLLIQTEVPPKGDRPGIQVRIECRDPTATGLDGFVPTLVEAVMELPLDGRNENFGQPITFAAGKPVRVRLRYARSPALAGTAPTSQVSLTLESQGADGLLKIDSASGGLGAKIAVTAGTLATALIADGAQQTPAPDGDGSGVVLHTLLTAAVALSSFLDQGQLVLHGAELMTTGGTIPVGKAMRLKIDYSCAATVTGIDVGVLSVQMHPNQPLRVRVREVVLTIDPAQSGLKMIHLDYARSSFEVEDPGGWMVNGPGSLFDVLGTRSGRGSMWIEVDLRFKLDLGPVKVSGITLRGTLDANGKLSASMRGLDASIALDPMVTGSGGVGLTETGFHAALEASILPLGGMGASADVQTADKMVKLALGVDLPGPLPLGNSGLGIYGIGGMFAANGRPRPVPPGADPIQAALDWDYTQNDAFIEAPDFSFGLEAVIGTAPDLGFTFSARAGLFITTPDIVVRGSVEGHYMGPRMKIARSGNDISLLQAKGVILVDPDDGVTIAVEGKYEIPHILVTTVPVGAHFPTKSSNWFIHLGADGWTPPAGAPSESREGGPIRSVFLPDIIGQTSDAYLMMRGGGITKWPRNGSYSFGPGCFVIAFGVGFDIVYGFKPVLWADVFAQADILVATHPMSFVGVGTIGGGLHIGVFSVGIDATVNVVLVDGAPPYLKADLCGSIDLFFDTIRKCVTLEFGNPAKADMPPPSEHPLDGAQSMVDDRYHRLAPLVTAIGDATPDKAVWPDSIPMLTFSAAPTLSVASAQFPDVGKYPEGLRARPIGSDLLSYDWDLLDIALIDATGPDAVVAGAFSNTWLPGKGGDAGSQPQPAELALLTTSGDLWLNALADAGAGLAEPPLLARADICHARSDARFGWALGAASTREGDAWRLPPDPRSPDPLQSQVNALVELLFAQAAPQVGVVLSDSAVQLLPIQFGYTGPRVRSFVPQVLDGREFDAWLDPGASLLPPGSLPGPGIAFDRAGPIHELRIGVVDTLDQAHLWLVLDAAFWTADPAAPRVFVVSDDLGRAWLPDLHSDLGDGWVAVRWLPPAPGIVKRMIARCPAGIRMGVLALGGITQAAAAAADARNAATAAEAAKQAQAAADGPPDAGTPPSKTRRCVLDPGRLYRIDVRMRWSGTLYQVDDQGNKNPLAQGSDESVRSFWFRTAALHAGGAPQVGSAARFAYLRHRQDLFDPEMLERHLQAYDPAQSELQRFVVDPVQVHFAPAHVDRLAGAYNFELHCAVRRLDQPATIEPDQLCKPTLAWATTTAHMTGSQAIIAQAYIASACGLAPNAVVLSVNPILTRDTWYEVFVLAKSTQPGVNDGRLPGVSFRTSRWADGSEMMTGLRFPVSGFGSADGGVALRPGTVLAPRVSNDDDSAFDAFLADLGMDGWPRAADPRASLLWLPPLAPSSAWRCAGVLLESPEPIHRTGRFLVDDLQLSMGGSAVAFDVRLRDRSGSRLLFATSTPFTPRRTRRGRIFPWVPPKLQLRCTDLPIGKPKKSLQGLIEIPLQPSFAEEAQ